MKDDGLHASLCKAASVAAVGIMKLLVDHGADVEANGRDVSSMKLVL
jgi:hypothetical protein